MPTPSLPEILTDALTLVNQQLLAFTTDTEFNDKLTLTFGNAINLQFYQQLWHSSDFNLESVIEIRTKNELNGANGAFSRDTGKIYLAEEYLQQFSIPLNPPSEGGLYQVVFHLSKGGKGGLNQIASLILEEYGHLIDAEVNPVESIGDEGAIFAKLVQYETISPSELQALQSEDDTANILLDGQVINIEQANITGTEGNDNRTGTAEADLILGLGGNDTLSGLGGNDTLDGGEGTNNLDGGTGNDRLINNFGNVYGREDIDVLIADYTNLDYGGNGIYNEANRIRSLANTNVFLYFETVENLNIIGTKYGDFFNINQGDNFDGIGGTDRFNLNLQNVTTPVNLNLTQTNNLTVANNTVVKNFEQIGTIRTGSGDDTFTLGTAAYAFADGSSQIYAGEGTDILILDYSASTYGNNGIYNEANRIRSRANTATLLYFEGVEYFNVIGTQYDDIFSIKEGDSFDGIGGTDRFNLNLQNVTTPVNLNLTQSVNVNVANTLVKNFEQIGTVTAGSGNDTFTLGSAGYAFADGSSQIYAGEGTDTLILDYSASTYGSNGIYNEANRIRSRANTATLLYFDGVEYFDVIGTQYNDIFTIKEGDSFDGIGGTDRFSLNLQNVTEAVNLNLTQTNNLTVANNTVVKNFEQIRTIRTGSGDDTFTLGTAAYAFTDGSSQIYAGEGTDILILDYSASTYGNNGIYNDANRIRSRANTATLLYFEGVEYLNVIGTQYNDIFTINEGDSFDGIGGTDRFNLNLENVTTSVNLNLTQSINLDTANTLVKNFEQIGTITTGSGNDTFTLSSAAYAFADGSSQIYAGAGTDTLILDYSGSTYGNNGIYNEANRIRSRANTASLLYFEGVERFNIIGTQYADNLQGFANNDTLVGGAGNDTVNGGAGNDLIIGVNPYTATPGINEIDNLAGGAGSDIFVLENNTTVFYDDNNITNAGTGNYALITDFNINEDKIQLQGAKSNYSLTVSGANTSVYLNKPSGEPAELIAVIQGVTGLDINASYFVAPKDEIAFSSANFTVTEDGATQAAITLSRTFGNRGASSVTVNSSNVTATAGQDYTNTPINVTFADGESSKTVYIPLLDDTVYEGSETVNLTLSNPSAGTTLGSQNNAVLTIIDNSTLAFSQANYTVNENGTFAPITITRTGGTDEAVSVDLTLTNGTATAPNDYINNSPITVNFASGERTKTVNIPIVNDTKFEFYETVNLNLNNPTGAAILSNQSTAQLTISPNFTLNGVSKQATGINNSNPVLRLTDGLNQSGSAFLTDRISLDDNASFSTSFQFQISNPQGSSDNDGQGADGLVFVVQTIANNVGGSGVGIGYSGLNKSLGIEFDTWNNGGIDDNSGNHVGINLNGNIDSVVLQPVGTRLNNGNIWTAWVDYNGVDGLLEVRLAETNQRPDNPLLSYNVDLISILQTPNAYIGFTSGTGSAGGFHDILNWDFNTTYQPISAGKLAFSSPTYIVNEDATALVAVTINRTGGSFGEVSTTITLSDGSAIAPDDYTNTPITITFADKETSKTVTIPINNDTVYEPTETVNLTLNGANLGNNKTATLNILDDDANAGTLNFSATSYTIQEDNINNAIVTITRSNGTDGNISANIYLTNGTATAGDDFINTSIPVTFANGETSKTVKIPIINDTLQEGNETFNLTLGNVTGGAFLGNQKTAIVTIPENDFSPRIEITTNILPPSQGGLGGISEGSSIIGTITANFTPNQNLVINLNSSDANQINVPSSVTILANSNSVNFNISAVNDDLIELTRNYNIIASSANLIGDSATVQVIDNDDVNLTFNIVGVQGLNPINSISENSGKAIATITRNQISNQAQTIIVGVQGLNPQGLNPNPVVSIEGVSLTPLQTVNVTIPANQASVSFEIQAIDNSILEGDRSVTLTATPTYTNTSVPIEDSAVTANVTIIDDESPSLTLTIDKTIIAETGTATATVTRNTATNSNLTVNLSSNDTSEAIVPNSVIIPNGQNSTTFIIQGQNDNISDGSQPVIITASANGLNSGITVIDVTDIEVPDLVISSLGADSPAYSDKLAQFTYKVENKGLSPTNDTWIDRVYLSTDNKLDANDELLTEFEITANIQVNQFYERNVSYFNPRTPGEYYLIAIVDADNTLNEGIGNGENNNTVIAPFTVVPAYSAEVSTDINIAVNGQNIILQGTAKSNEDNSPIPYEFVTIEVENKGFIRKLNGFTDSNGNFVRSFSPLQGEGGIFNIRAYFPDNQEEDTDYEDSFKVLGAKLSTDKVSHQIIADTPFTASVQLANLTDIALTNFNYDVSSLPDNWDVQVTLAEDLAGNGINTVTYTINAPNNSLITQDTFNINLVSAEGVTATLPVTVDLERIVPRLVADTSLIEAGMLRGEQTFVEIELTNEGGRIAEKIEVILPQADWLSLATTDTIESLAPGESTNVILSLTPSDTQNLTEYTGNIVFDAEGDDGDLSLNFNFRAVSQAVGNLSVNVVDELFYFAEGSPKLSGAEVIVRDYFTQAEIKRLITDETGIVKFEDLPEGYYTLEVKADDHDSFSQTIQLDAGENELVNSFLSRQTVKYIWNVTPTEIEDRYDITVESVFETDVPIPTVVIEPPLIDLADLQVVGQVMQVDMTITNYGLIAAQGLELSFGDHPFYKIEPLLDSIDTLDAKSSITIPVRITRIADFDTLNANSSELSISASPSVPCNIEGSLKSFYICGIPIFKVSTIGFKNVEGNCPPGGSGGGGLIGGGGSGGSGGSSVTSKVPVIVDTSNCCIPLKVNFDDAGFLANVLTGLFNRAKKELKERLGLEGGIDFSAKINGSAEICCEPVTGYKIKANGEIGASGTLGANLKYGEQKFNFSGIDVKISPFNIGAFSKPFLKVVGQAIKECDGKLCITAQVEGGIELFAGINASAEFRKGNLVEKGGVKIALAGKVSVTGTYNSCGESTLCVKSDGLYLEISGTAFGENIGGKIYIIEPAFLGNCLNPKSLSELGFFSDTNDIDNLVFSDSYLNELVEKDLTQRFLNSGVPLSTIQEAIKNDSLGNNEGNSNEQNNNQSGVCAKVRIQINQEAVMTRSAFLGELIIENTSDTIKLEDITVTLQVKDINGNIVNELFGITKPILENLNAVDGTGILGVNSLGSAEWTFIPTNLAAKQTATTYSIGGTLSYEQDGKLITVPLLSTPITVYPQAELYLDYFHQRDVFGDDPFTDATEVSEPFSLAVLVRNEGYGDAKNLSITSAQPKIIENEKGLLIDFDIIGTQINNNPIEPTLKADFGTISAGETAVADWQLKSTLQGKFIEYSATFEHINDLGNPELSLIKEVKIHELIHKVQADTDNLPDFFVNDLEDANFYPDTLYFSDGTTAPVTAIDEVTVDAPVTILDLQAEITLSPTSQGWTYIRLEDPADGQFSIEKILRSDGTEVKPENIWRTDRTFPATGRPIYENILHFLDFNSTGSYTVIYDSNDSAPPQVREIIDVSPNPRDIPVDNLTVVFTEPIRANTFTNADLTLTRADGVSTGALPLQLDGVTISQIDPLTFQINNLTTLTGNIGNYQLKVNATGIQDLAGNYGAGFVTENWIFTGDRPAVESITGFTSNIVTTAINEFTVTFTEAIVANSFDYQDITLTRNDGGNLVNNTVTITPINNRTYKVSNLAQFTGIEGDYELLVTANNIQDLDNNNGIGGKGFTWSLDNSAPSLIDIDDVTSPRNSAIASLEVQFDQPINPDTFDKNDLVVTLTQEGVSLTPLQLNGVEIDKRNETVYIIKGLRGLQTNINNEIETLVDGEYTLTVNGAGIKDIAGNPVDNNISANWIIDSEKPLLATNITITNTFPPSQAGLGGLNSPPSQGGLGGLESLSETGLGGLNSTSIPILSPLERGRIIAPLNAYGQYLVNSTELTISGKLSETGLLVYMEDKTTGETLAQAEVNGTEFSGDISLSGAGSRTIELIIRDTAGNSTSGEIEIFADLTQPTIIEFSGLPNTPNYEAVAEIEVTFSEKIDLDTFNYEDITLTRNGEILILDNSITVEFIGDKSYRILGLENFTQAIGTYNLVVNATTISDQAGNIGLAADSVTFSVEEIPTPDLLIIQTGGITQVSEDGNTDSYSLRLNTQPTANVTIELTVNNSQLNLDKTSLTFTPDNWNLGQTVNVSTVDDTDTEGDQIITINHTSISTDNQYNGLTAELDVNVIDNDAEIGGVVWHDVNGNGAFDSDESGIADWVLYLDENLNQELDDDETQVKTNSNGEYIFTGLTQGTYTIAQQLQTDWQQTYPQLTTKNNLSSLSNLSQPPIFGDQRGLSGEIDVTTTASDAPIYTIGLENPIGSYQNFSATDLINIDEFRTDSRFANIDGSGFSTVIIDTGIDLNHSAFGEDLDGNGIADKIVYQYDFGNNDNDASDKNNHGSNVASIIASENSTYPGIATGSDLIILKIFKDDGSGSFADLEEALQWVVNHGEEYNVASVNLSLGDSKNWNSYQSPYGVGDEFAALASQNIVVSAAAGNDFYKFNSEIGLAYPSADENVLAVGAVWADDFGSKSFSSGAKDNSTDADRIASFSQRHPELLDIFAPGASIVGANQNGGTVSLMGTSQASPYIAGVATLAQQVAQQYLGRKLTVAEFEQLLKDTGTVINDGDDENDNVTNTNANYPRVDMLALAEAIVSLDEDINTSPNNENPETNHISSAYTVTVAGGDSITDIDFGNQFLGENQPSFDIDGDGQYLASVDGLLFYGYLNIRGIGVPSLITNLTQQLADNLINPDGNATRKTGAEIAQYLENNQEMLDIDGDGSISASIDGLLGYGYLNIRGIGVPALINNLTQQLADNLIPDGSNADRTSGEAIANYLESYIPHSAYFNR